MSDQWGIVPLPLGQQFDAPANEQPNQPADIFGGFIDGWTPSAAGVTGSLTASEVGSDSFDSTGQIVVQGALASTEIGSDEFSSSGSVLVQGALTVAEVGSDSFSSSGQVVIQGSLSSTEVGADSFTGSGQVLIQGSLAVTESGNDSFNAGGLVLVQGSLSATETDDSFSATGSVSSNAITGDLSATEVGSDAFESSGLVLIHGSFAANESGDDTFEATGYQEKKVRGITGGGIKRSKILEAAQWILDLLDKDTVKQTEPIKKVKAKLKKVKKLEDIQELQPIVNTAIVEIQKQKKISDDLVRLNFIINELKIIKNQLDDEEEALIMLMA